MRDNKVYVVFFQTQGNVRGGYGKIIKVFSLRKEAEQYCEMAEDTLEKAMEEARNYDGNMTPVEFIFEFDNKNLLANRRDSYFCVLEFNVESMWK